MDNMRRRAGRYLGVNPVIQNRERGVLSVSFDDIPASAWTEAAAGLFASAETRTLKTETTIDKLRAKFGKDAVIAGRALKKG